MTKYPESIVQNELTECYVCGCRRNLEIHHIMSGNANRKLSTTYGLVCALCYDHHRGAIGVHQDIILNERLKKDAQRAFEERYGHTKWMSLFKKNYL